jgi:hypothetical protein
VPFAEMAAARPAADSIWNPATKLFEVAVYRRHGPPLIVKNLQPGTADRLRRAITEVLRERRRSS